MPSSKRVPKVLKWFDNPYFIQKQPNLEALDNGNDDNDINNIIDEAKINLGKLTQGYLTHNFSHFSNPILNSLYVFSAIHKKFLRRFDTIFGLKKLF